MNSFIVLPSPRLRIVQSRAIISVSTETSSSISFIVGVIYESYPSYSILIIPITGREVSSFIAMISRMLFVRIQGEPAFLAARAIRYIIDLSSTYRGSDGRA